MNKNEFVQKRIKKIKEIWFKDHVAEYRLVEYIYENAEYDGEFAHGCYEAGCSINMRALSHFIGLAMANTQLKNKE